MQELTYRIYTEGDTVVAECMDVEVSSDGITEAEAVANLQEALSLYLDGEEVILSKATEAPTLAAVEGLIKEIGKKAEGE